MTTVVDLRHLPLPDAFDEALRIVLESEYPEPNTPDDIPGDAGVPEEPNTEVRNDPVPEDEEEPK